MPVRVTNMRGIDLDTFAFDFDLTFSALLMHPDGTVYHRYGGRDARSASSFLSLKSFLLLLKEGEQTHAEYIKNPAPPTIKRRTLDDIPVWAEKMRKRKKRQDCYHCHFVFDAEREQHKANGTWKRDLIWRFPPPARIGLTLDKHDQRKLTKVRRGSPAWKAGLRKGDLLERLGKQRVLTQSDVSWVLEKTPHAGADLALRYRRRGKPVEATLRLKQGWRIGTPLEFSWRPSKWQLDPRPGFGGRPLTARERRRFKIKQGRLAFRVGYLVTWGKIPRYGHNARRAGIRKGDIVTNIRIGRRRPKLQNMHHFHSWWRLTLKPGQTVRLTTIRRGKRREVELPVIK